MREGWLPTRCCVNPNTQAFRNLRIGVCHVTKSQKLGFWPIWGPPGIWSMSHPTDQLNTLWHALGLQLSQSHKCSSPSGWMCVWLQWQSKHIRSHHQDETSDKSPCCRSPKPSPASLLEAPCHSRKPDFKADQLHSLMNISFMATLTVIFLMVFPSARSHLTGVKLGLLQLDMQRCTSLFSF